MGRKKKKVFCQDKHALFLSIHTSMYKKMRQSAKVFFSFIYFYMYIVNACIAYIYSGQYEESHFKNTHTALRTHARKMFTKKIFEFSFSRVLGKHQYFLSSLLWRSVRVYTPDFLYLSLLKCVYALQFYANREHIYSGGHKHSNNFLICEIKYMIFKKNSGENIFMIASVHTR